MSTLYLHHFGLADAPFAITPDPHFFFAGGCRGELLRALRCAVTSEEGIIVVTGEVGSGKTMLCRMLLADLPHGVDAIYLANPAFARDEIVSAIARDLGVNTLPQPGGPTVIEALQAELVARHAAGRRVVLFIDEAHAMGAEALEEVRRLSNVETSRHKLLNIVLFGQPELDDLLAQPGLRQLRERVVQRLFLPPLPSDQVGDYVNCRLRAAGWRGAALFDHRALRRLQRRSCGLTRRINLLADKALLACFARGDRRVAVADVLRAERELAFAAPRRSWYRWTVAAIAALLTASLAVYLGLSRLEVRPTVSTQVAPSVGAPSADANGTADARRSGRRGEAT